MRLQYDLKSEDYVEFNMFHILNSKTVKHSLFIQRYGVPIIFLIVPFIFERITVIPLVFWVIPYIIIYMIWVVFYPRYFRRYTRRTTQKIINEGKNKNIFGPISLSLENSGIVEVSNLGESKINWNAIERIEETDDYIFIYISSVNAYIIPKRAFENVGMKNEFMSILKSHLSA